MTLFPGFLEVTILSYLLGRGGITMDHWDKLYEILEAGIKKHGEKPLTNAWLLNMMRRVDQLVEQEEEEGIIIENSIEVE